MIRKISSTDAGWTLVELVGMIALLGILTIVAIPTSDVGSAALDACAHRLRADLHFAQQMATTSGTAYGFRSLSGTQYEIFVGAPGTPAVDPYRRTAFQIDIQEIYRGVQFSGAPPTVTFTPPDGIPAIAGGPTIVLTNGTATKTIVITATTGVPLIQ
ncbi:MAG: GspH/FimT family pseudopilin [Deltaproteobacteria bacterium]|nr:GspH/FimT family pseudopilin [Deltaproteobacteria bacterium]